MTNTHIFLPPQAFNFRRMSVHVGNHTCKRADMQVTNNIIRGVEIVLN